jgi:Bacterial EndoU nuclease
MEEINIKFAKIHKQGIRSYNIIENNSQDLYILAYFLSFEIWGWRSYTLYTNWLKSLPSKKIIGGNDCRLVKADGNVILYFEEDVRHYKSYKDVPDLHYFSVTPGDLITIIEQWVKLVFINSFPSEITITQKKGIVTTELTDKWPIRFDLDYIFLMNMDAYMKGFHSDFEREIEKAGKIIFSHHEEGPNGIYRAVVEYAGVRSEKTFFPQNWDCEMVIKKTSEALKQVDLSSYTLYSDDRIRFFAYTSEGIQLDILLDLVSEQIVSVYPTYSLWKYGDLLTRVLEKC